MDGANRRQVLGGATAGLALAATSRALARTPIPIGAELWTINAELDRDVDGALKRLAAIGYRRVEAAGGFHGRTAAQYAEALRRAGLACDSVAFSMPYLQQDLPARLAEAKTLGARWLVCSSPITAGPLDPKLDWLTAMGRAMTLQAWKRHAALLNQVGAAAAKAGLRFAYHNHSFDFGTYQGVTPYDEVMRLTDPGLVHFELDVGWAVWGGRDPIALMRRYAGRIRLLHLKDLTSPPEPGAQPVTVPLGQGFIDWRAILRAAEAAGVAEAFVEQEPPFTKPALDALAASWRYLQSL